MTWVISWCSSEIEASHSRTKALKTIQEHVAYLDTLYPIPDPKDPDFWEKVRKADLTTIYFVHALQQYDDMGGR